MTKLDEETLMAYVDGQLDRQRAAEVEALLAEDAEARATVHMFQDSAAKVRQAFDDILREPVPARLLAAVNAPAAGKVSDVRLARRRSRWRFFPQTAWAQAAAVALLIGAGAGYLTAQWPPHNVEQSARFAAVDPLLNEVLETTASGAAHIRREPATGVSREILPLLTFRDTNGQFCREFESSLAVRDGQQVHYGVACRTQGVWQPLALMARQLIAPTLHGDPATDHSQYVPAMGSDVANFDTIIRQLMAGAPLTSEEEAALLNRGWQ